jgi:heme A synthase
MRPSRILIAALLLLVGLVWIGQGTGRIAGSAMTGVSFWAAAGVVLVVLAVVVVARESWLVARRSRSRPG